MNGGRVILAAVVIFLAGAATGGLVVRAYAPKVVKRTHVSPPLPVSHDRREEYISKLDRELDLTDNQRVEIEKILAASQKRMKAIWEPVEPQVKDEYRRTRREISELLNPEQLAKFKSWRKGDKGDKDNKDDHRGKDGGKYGGKYGRDDKEPLKSAAQPEEKQKCCAKPTLIEVINCL